jgi:alpha-1,4-fucosyltransferase
MLVVPPKPINTITITIMLAFTFFLLFFSGFFQFPSVSPSLPPFHESFTLPSTNTSSQPFTDLVSSFRKWDLQVGCAKFREKTNGVSLNQSKIVSLQEFGGDSQCKGFKLNHVSVLVKGWTWIPDNLDNLYSCHCGLSCLWTKSNVLADKPDALMFETSTPPIQVVFFFMVEMFH